MCGRFALTGSLNWLFRLLFLEPPPVFADRYNIAPTQPVFAFLYDIDRNRLRYDFLSWGLVPPFIKDPGEISTLINARAETLREKPAFKNAFRYRRCILPASGFYEWKRAAAAAEPFYFSVAATAGQLCLAGIWEIWHGEAGEQMNSCAIITVPANRTVQKVHHRMPAIIAPDQITAWLNPEAAQNDLAKLLRPASDDLLASTRVSSFVNSTRNEGPECVRPEMPQGPFQPDLFSE